MKFYYWIVKFVAKTFRAKKKTNGEYDEGVYITAGFIFAFIILWTGGRLAYGISVANDPQECRMRSIGDFIIAPMYTVGCNIGKDRWNIKVN